MPVIQVKDKQHSLKPGQTKIGAGAGVDVVVPGDASLGVQAIFELSGDNNVVIRRASDAAKVKVNGVALVDPTPLMHGDKVEISGTDVLFSEDKKVGATQFVSAADVAAIATAKRAGPARATAATGGRLVSLVDGKEYQIPAAGITFGREAGSDVVVAQPEVSRRHATIAPDGTGYVLTDLSTNGVWVNGNRLQGSQVLARADVVRVGNEEFRFYADVAPAGAKPTAPTPSASAPPVAATPAPAAPAQAAAPPPAPAPKPVASTPAPATASPRSAPPARPIEPPTAPKAAPTAATKKKEPPTAPTPVAAAADKKGIPNVVWLIVVIIVIGVTYYLAKG
jgi:pSer/pThr/pTyr-binding forkhead associated (FHA) protein